MNDFGQTFMLAIAFVFALLVFGGIITACKIATGFIHTMAIHIKNIAKKLTITKGGST